MASRCYTFAQLVETICREAGIPGPRFTIPLELIRPFAGLGTFYGNLTRQPAWFSSYTVYNLSSNNDYSEEKGERELGF